MNTLDLRRVMFSVDDIDAVVARMRAQGAELIGEMQYEQPIADLVHEAHAAGSCITTALNKEPT